MSFDDEIVFKVVLHFDSKVFDALEVWGSVGEYLRKDGAKWK